MNVQLNALNQSKFIENGLKNKSPEERADFIRYVLRLDHVPGVKVPSLSEAARTNWLSSYERRCMNRHGDVPLSKQDLLDEYKFKYIRNLKNDASIIDNPEAFTKIAEDMLKADQLEAGKAYAMDQLILNARTGLNRPGKISAAINKINESFINKEKEIPADYFKGKEIPVAGSPERTALVEEILLEKLGKNVEARLESEKNSPSAKSVVVDQLVAANTQYKTASEFKLLNSELFDQMVEKIGPKVNFERMSDYDATKELPEGKEKIRQEFLTTIRASEGYQRLLDADPEHLATEMEIFRTKGVEDSIYDKTKSAFAGAKNQYQESHEEIQASVDDILKDEREAFHQELHEYEKIVKQDPEDTYNKLQDADPWYRGSSKQFDDFKAKATEAMTLYRNVFGNRGLDLTVAPQFVEEFQQKNRAVIDSANAYIAHKDAQVTASGKELTGLSLTRYNLAKELRSMVQVRQERVEHLQEKEVKRKVRDQLENERKERLANVTAFDQRTANLTLRIDRIKENLKQSDLYSEDKRKEIEGFLEDGMNSRVILTERMNTQNSFKWDEVKEEVAKDAALIRMVNLLENGQRVELPDESSMERFETYMETKLPDSDMKNLVSFLGDETSRFQDGYFLTESNRINAHVENLQERFLGGDASEKLLKERKELSDAIHKKYNPENSKDIKARDAMSNEELNQVDVMDFRIAFARSIVHLKEQAGLALEGKEVSISPEDAARVHLYAKYQDDPDFKALFGDHVDEKMDHNMLMRAQKMMHNSVKNLANSEKFKSFLKDKDPQQMKWKISSLMDGDTTLGFGKRFFADAFAKNAKDELANELQKMRKEYLKNPSGYQRPADYGEKAMKYMLLSQGLSDNTFTSMEDIDEKVAKELSNPSPNYQKAFKYLLEEANMALDAKQLDILQETIRQIEEKNPGALERAEDKPLSVSEQLERFPDSIKTEAFMKEINKTQMKQVEDNILEESKKNRWVKVHSEAIDATLEKGIDARLKLGKILTESEYPLSKELEDQCKELRKDIFLANVVRGMDRRGTLKAETYVEPKMDNKIFNAAFGFDKPIKSRVEVEEILSLEKSEAISNEVMKVFTKRSELSKELEKN